MKSKKELSAGCVVFKKLEDGSFVYLLGKHSGYHKWVLPKGMIEEGETEKQTAVRETEEEIAVKAKIVRREPIYIEKYSYQAELKKKQNSDSSKPFRRVLNYQENGGKGVMVEKTVTFFLASFISGNPKNHGWEMENAGWFDFEKCLRLMSFEGEKKALEIADKILNNENNNK